MAMESMTQKAEVAASGAGLGGLPATMRNAGCVGDLALAPAPVIPAKVTMAAARKIADLKGSPILLVERDGILAGVLDPAALMTSPDDRSAGDAMCRLDFSLTPTTPLPRARELFVRTGSAALPVAAGAFLLGVLTRSALERGLRQLECPPLDAGSRRQPRLDAPGRSDVGRRNAA